MTVFSNLEPASGALIKKADTLLSGMEPLEGLLFVALVAMGVAIGVLLNRIIDRVPKDRWQWRFVDYVAPLFSPLFAAGLMTIALVAFERYEVKPTLLPLGLKLAVAWCAIRLVMLMSTRQTAGWLIALVIIPITVLHLFGLWVPLRKTLMGWKIELGSIDITAYTIVKSMIAVVILFWLAGGIVKLVEGRLLRIRTLKPSNRALIMQIFQIVLYFIVFMVMLQVVGIDLMALSVFGGALGVGLGFGLQKIASNFISGIIMLFEKSTEVDDLVELADGTSGFVRHTGARYTLIETFDGKEVLVPNEDFITQRIINWTYSHRKARVDIAVSIAYENNPREALRLMSEVASAHPKCMEEPKPFAFVSRFGDNGIELGLFFWVPDVVDGRLDPKSEVMIGILEAFRAHNISIPYPQRIVRMAEAEAAS
jgi:small-conductance mechanosensitive channel